MSPALATSSSVSDQTFAQPLSATDLVRFLRIELLKLRLDGSSAQQAEILTVNFPIDLPWGYRSLLPLMDSDRLAGLPRERFYFRDRSRSDSAARSTNVGIGARTVLLASGEGRFEAIKREAQRLFSRVTIVDHPGLTGHRRDHAPRLFGGFSFAPGSADRFPWHDEAGSFGFGDARFVLVKIAVRCLEGGSLGESSAEARNRGLLTVTIPTRGAAIAGRKNDPEERELDELGRALETILTVVSSRPTNSWRNDPLSSEAVESCPGSGSGFQASVASLVDHAVTQVESGAFEKVVVARHLDLDVDTDLTAEAKAGAGSLLDRLDRLTEGGAGFALMTGSSAGNRAVFLGAPPERLVSVRDGRLETEAVAGSRPRPDCHSENSFEPDPDDLFRPDDKDTREHRSVVEHLATVLGFYCLGNRVEIAEPEVKAHPALLHLETRVSAALRPGLHILDLVARLHPTPAVCGAPFAETLAYLEATEEQPRGWYAAPIGWFDSAGEGEFAVALRSAVIQGGSARLFAGAGIVAGSRPAVEAREIARKMLPMARVLAPYLEPAKSAPALLPFPKTGSGDARPQPSYKRSTNDRGWKKVLALVGLFH